METPVMTTVLGRYPYVEPLRSGAVSPERMTLAFTDVEPVHDAFDAMVQDLRYDVCEIAVGAFFQGLGAGQPLRLLPVVTLGRHQHGSIYVNPRAAAAKGIATPADLAGHRVAVRSYSQTTGLWVRGILAEEYGLDLAKVTWVTTEASHLDGFTDPPNAVRAPQGRTVLDLLRSGEVDGAIHAPGLAESEWCRPLVPNVAAASASYAERLGAVPINHLVCVGPRVGGDPDLTGDLYAALRRSYESSGVLADARSGVTLDPEAIAGVLHRALPMAESQGLVAPGLDVARMFAAGFERAGARS